MGKAIAVSLLAILISAAITAGFYALMAWLFSSLVSAITGFDLGFWRSIGGLICVTIIGFAWRGGHVRPE